MDQQHRTRGSYAVTYPFYILASLGGGPTSRHDGVLVGSRLSQTYFVVNSIYIFFVVTCTRTVERVESDNGLTTEKQRERERKQTQRGKRRYTWYTFVCLDGPVRVITAATIAPSCMDRGFHDELAAFTKEIGRERERDNVKERSMYSMLSGGA